MSRLRACLVFLPLAFVFTAHSLRAQEAVPVGLAKIDITPEYPIRLAGFGFRRTESEGIAQRIWAKALVIGHDQPVLLLALDACGVSHEFTEKIAARLVEKLKLPRERFALTVTHTHTAPMIQGYLPTLFGQAIPPEHLKHIEQYTAELLEKLEKVAEQAMQSRQPALLSWGMGTVTFAKNRRTAGGPVDHDMPLLVIRDQQSKLRGVWVNYACHCVTLSNNKIGGDWAGFAAELIEKEHPGATALVAIGCGADSNPDSGVTGDKSEIAQKQGGFIAAEVDRLLKGYLTPIPGTVSAKFSSFTLPLGKLPTQAELEEKAKRNDAIGYHARMQLEDIAKGDKLPTIIPYSVQTWAFGESMAMVFLPGEVVVDYALRLKKELHGQRLWVNAYANHVPCYIPSERILREGGYEGAGAMTYYNLPGPLATGLEEKIIGEVKKQLEPTFRPPYDPSKLGGSKPLSPQQSARTIKVRQGLEVELVAAEPMVTSPVAIAFGPDNKLWVAEMYDYPKGLDGNFQAGGRIKFLESALGNGRFDKATVFLDNIPFPTGVTAWRKGVLICSAPDILYAEDTNGDGKADVVKKLFSGFGTHNYQARVNSLEYGLDGWVYGSCGLLGGTITSFTGKMLQLGNRDFRIKPDTGEIEAATGATQQGRVRDDWDNWFGCDNSMLARHYPIHEHYLSRNQQLRAPPTSIFVAQGPGASKLFPARQQVQLFELSGPPGLPTAACGLGVYRDDLLGRDLQGNLFTCEPVNLVVHRLKLDSQGSSFIGQRPSDELNSEFLTGTDNWFRPVQMRTGPDGCIWIVDMHRLVIEHPMWIPPADLARLDVRAGSTMGRLYRIKSSEKPVRKMPRLDQLDDAALARAIDSLNGTQRDLAMMELVWRKSSSSSSELEQIAKSSAHPEARVQALCTLDQLGMLSEDLIVSGLTNAHTCRNALRLSEKRLGESGPIQRVVRSVVQNPPVGSPVQLACTLGAWADPEAGVLLANLLTEQPADITLRIAILSSVGETQNDAFLQTVIAQAQASKAIVDLRRILQATLQGNSPERVVQLLESAVPVSSNYAPWQLEMGASLVRLMEARSDLTERVQNRMQKLMGPLFQAARQVATDNQAAPSARLQAIELLACGSPGRTNPPENRELLLSLLGTQHPQDIQQGSLNALLHRFDEAVARQLCRRWKSYSPSIRSRLMETLLGTEKMQRILMDAIVERGEIPASQIDASSKQRLLHSRNQDIRIVAEKIFAATTGDRLKVLQDYSAKVTKGGDVQKGHAVFAKVCASCHKLGEQGHSVGPDLMALANRSPAFLLQEILDPNRNLDSRYVEYVAVTKQGRTITGLLTGETNNSLTLKGKEGREESLLRNELEELQATGKSLMPEGLEKEMTPAEVSDLLSYLGTINRRYKSFVGNQPAEIKAEKEVMTLPAALAEIYGHQIAFENAFGNIGMWHDVADHVVWTVQVPRKAFYDVYFDWACANESASNHYLLEVGNKTLSGEVAGTGGWSHYLRVRIGHLQLEEGLQRVIVRPLGPNLRGALMDLRTVYIAPNEHRLNLEDATIRQKPDLASLAKRLLDDKTPHEERHQIIQQNLPHAAELIGAMTTDLPNDPKEEYRRIPWIWRVAIAAGKKNDAAVLRRMLDVSMPGQGQVLRDWQAVVIGGGIINGISQLDIWPHERLIELLAENPLLQKRWHGLLVQSAAMADNEKISTGTRYDALRIIALDQPERAVPALKKYLVKGSNEELQMGSVSGLVDVPTSEATQLLADALGYLKGENLRLAIEGLMRTEERAISLLEKVEKGQLASSALTAALKTKLKTKSATWSSETQKRIARVLE